MINNAEILSQFEKNGKTEISFHYHSENLLKSIDGFFSKLLAKMDMIFLLDFIVTVLREIISNAVKANAKRFYFNKLTININNPEEYANGIKKFKSDVIGTNILEKELEKTDYQAVLRIEKENNGIRIIVENNTLIHPEELKRINFRIQKAKEYKDFTAAYDEIYDETEGAGLGIVLTILLLKSTGVGENSFSITSNGKSTQAQFLIPFILKPNEITTKIKEQIISEIDGLPSFNHDILELLKLCKDPDSDIEVIEKKIIIDPALTTEIMKMSNSAGFYLGKKIELISEAIMIIGLTNLHDLLLVTGTRRILEKRYTKFNEIWNHCTKTANYAMYIARKFSQSKNIEFAYIGGLLHDLGKLVLLATGAKFAGWIADLTKDRKIRTSTVLEEVSIGISHSAIGELMAKKWNFPDYLVEVIKFHHSPLEVSEKFKEIIYSVYLANMFSGFEIGRYNYYYLEETVLEKFKLFSRQDVDDLHRELKEISNGKV
jgi:putative nucleotidyltransferase with HDIG domain